jgi:hypothetical protein
LEAEKGDYSMKNDLIKSIIVIVLSLAVIIALIPGCNSKRPSPIDIKLSFSDSPTLGKPVQIIATFSLDNHWNGQVANNALVEILLPDGFEKVEGDLEWKGDIYQNKTYSLNALIQAVKTGDWEIVAKTIYDPDKSEHFISNSILYISVSENGATVSDKRPQTSYTPGPKVPSDVPLLTPTMTRPVTSPAYSSSQPTISKLSISEPPILGKPVKVTALFSILKDYQYDAENITAHIILPEGFEIIDGDLEWNGMLSRGETKTLSVRTCNTYRFESYIS